MMVGVDWVSPLHFIIPWYPFTHLLLMHLLKNQNFLWCREKKYRVEQLRNSEFIGAAASYNLQFGEMYRILNVLGSIDSTQQKGKKKEIKDSRGKDCHSVEESEPACGYYIFLVAMIHYINYYSSFALYTSHTFSSHNDPGYKCTK